MKAIQELVAYFERRKQLTPRQIDKLLRKGFLASEAPPTMQGLCDRVGEVYYFRVLGEETGGSVWGSDVYTGDSSLAAAALHAGAVKRGESAVVRVTVVAPLTQYAGSVRNGVTSRDYGRFGTAYRVEAV